ncbi:MAG: hypothetical protein JXM73_13985 [Anaerolineae bacterium]|nr:hypothetical protein [Anaerolineae bacterium]
MKLSRSFHLACSLLVGIAISMLVSRPASAQDNPPSSRDVILLVRDGAGAPLYGVVLDILEAGPPNEPYDQCTTNESGQCFTALFPDHLYIIQFSVKNSWRGRYFAALEEQSAPGEYCPGPGFCIYFSPDPANPEVDTITFVVAQRDDGLLQPAWDMSADASASPEPFFPPGQSSDNLDLSGLDAGLVAGPSPIAPESSSNDITTAASPTAQVVVSTYGAAGAPVPSVTPTPLPAVTSPPAPTLELDDIALGLLALAVVITLLVLITLWLRRKAR